MAVTAEQIRQVAMSLPRTTEGLVRDHVKYRVGRIVYVSLSPDESTMGFGYPRDQRDALIAAEPVKFTMPRKSDQRYQWVLARTREIGPVEMAELVLDAWCIVVSRRAATEFLAALPAGWPTFISMTNGDPQSSR